MGHSDEDRRQGVRQSLPGQEFLAGIKFLLKLLIENILYIIYNNTKHKSRNILDILEIPLDLCEFTSYIIVNCPFLFI